CLHLSGCPAAARRPRPPLGARRDPLPPRGAGADKGAGASSRRRDRWNLSLAAGVGHETMVDSERSSRMRLAGLIAVSFALLATTAAAGFGPSLPDVNGAVSVDEVSYVTAAHSNIDSTTLSKRVEGKVVARTTLRGEWGVPVVTMAGAHGGLSPDGGTLVL